MIDKALHNTDGYILTETGDLKTVENHGCTVQSANLRIMAERGSWTFDDSFGSRLFSLLKTRSVPLVSEKEIRAIITEALEFMIQDGRIKSLQEVKIVDRTQDEIKIQIRIELDTTIVVATYYVSNI